MTLLRNSSGAAAAEMALVTPLLVLMLFGFIEVGHYYYNEHIVVKAVRDGARFAARQDFTNYAACSGTPAGNVEADTRNLVLTGLRNGGTARLSGWSPTTVTVTASCTTTAGGQTMSGIYEGRASGAPIVTVSAIVPYSPLFGTLVVSGFKLSASQQASVTGI